VSESLFRWKFSKGRVIFYEGGNFFTGKCEVRNGGIVWMGVQIPKQDYKSLDPVVMT